MYLTEKLIHDLLDLLKCGLIHGAGYGTRFCVQQAVNRAVEGLGREYLPDWVNDGHNCLGEEVQSLGINLNDCGVWTDDQDRAKHLTRFAVAELGSADVSMTTFRNKLTEKLGYEWTENSINSRAQAIEIVDAAVKVLTELGTEGSKFLYILDEPDKKKARKEANRLGDKIWAAQFAEEKKAAKAKPQKLQ